MPSDEEFCLFQLGSSSLLKHVRDLQAEMEGVREAKGPEAVHQTRVASRRLRAGMQIFPYCLPKKKGKAWRKDVRNVTKALGLARDLDVQIGFLQSFLEQVDGRSRPPGSATILELKQDQRRELQAGVIEWMDELKKHDTAGRMEEHFAAEAKRTADAAVNCPESFAAGRALLCSRAREVIALESCVPLPQAVEEHHQMRIAVKRLRYSVEAFRPLFEDRLRTEIEQLKELQDLLGEMHDCDVWLSEREELAEVLAGQEGANEGLAALMEDRWRRRDEQYEKFAQLWPWMRRLRFFERLEERFRQGQAGEDDRGSRLSSARPRPLEDRLDELEGAALELNVDPDHAAQVRKLAIVLFHELAPLHGLKADALALLEASCLLHDIGIMEGVEGHNRISRRLVLENEELPLLDGERRFISAMVRYHRGRLPRVGGQGDEETVRRGA